MKIKLNYFVIIRNILLIYFAIQAYTIANDFIHYPEKYLTTLRYQLKCDIEQGNAEAITYYHNTYTANGLDLFNK